MLLKTDDEKQTPAGDRGPFLTAVPFLPDRVTLETMAQAAQGCRGCDIYKGATQAVFGEGPAAAPCVMVGEQPGNEEDLQGRVFVGPAGRLLDRALAEAGIPREAVYLTNAVKHFKNEPMGKRRKHKSPNTPEVKACRPWLEQELRLIRPKVVVCLGVTAAKSVMGRGVTLKEHRGRFVESEFSARTLITMHPSAILRSPDDDARHANFAALVEDLRLVARELA